MLSNRDTNYKGWWELTYCSKTHTCCRCTVIMRSVKAIYSFRHLTRTSQRGRTLCCKTNLYLPVRVSLWHQRRSAHELTVAAYVAQTSLWWYSRSEKMLWGNIRGECEHWYSSRACQSSLCGLDGWLNKKKKVSHSPSEISLQSLVNCLWLSGLCDISL